MFYIILQNVEENDLRSFYQSLLYINSFVLAPEMIMKIDFKIFMFANENLNSLLIKF